MSLDTFWEDIFGRTSAGPFKLRFILQPTMAAFFAIRAGLRDGREGRPAYLWTLFSDRGARRGLLKDGWKDVGKVFVMALVLDIIYQVIVFHTVHPVQSLLLAFALAIVPYLLLRGPVSRMARAAGGPRPQADKPPPA
jgi:hypothetical protein